jgi:hypothetical protein
VHEEEALSVEGNRTNKREGWPETKRKGCALSSSFNNVQQPTFNNQHHLKSQSLGI